MTLLERDELLAQLHARWSEARGGAGRLVFVEGEAGIGKTTVLRAFAASVRTDAPVYWGACEAMATPRPLGALDDIARDSGGKLAVLRDGSGERHRLFVAFVELLAERPALAVLEDVHWADEATLDLLRYAGRRIARTRSLLVASFRNDEVVPAHPLRAVLGDLATAGVPRLAPQPLSLAAVRSLCAEPASMRWLCTRRRQAIRSSSPRSWRRRARPCKVFRPPCRTRCWRAPDACRHRPAPCSTPPRSPGRAPRPGCCAN